MIKVSEIMTKEIISCEPATPVNKAAKLLADNHISAMPVLQEGKLAGIVGERELLKMEQPLHIPAFLDIMGTAVYLDNPLDGDEVEKQLKQVLATEVGTIMKRDVKTVSSSANTHELADIMIKENLDIVPVVDDEQLVGVVSKADIVKLLARE